MARGIIPRWDTTKVGDSPLPRHTDIDPPLSTFFGGGEPPEASARTLGGDFGEGGSPSVPLPSS